MAYSNFDNGLDFNSGARNIIYINCVSDTTTDPTLDSPNFNVHQGTQGSNWWINCTSTRSVDRGWSFGWDGNPWSIPAGTYYQFMINCISSGDSLYELTNSPGSAGPSLWVDPDDSTGTTSSWTVVNCDLATHTTTYGAVNYKGTIFSPANVANNTGGWFGTSCASLTS